MALRPGATGERMLLAGLIYWLQAQALRKTGNTNRVLLFAPRRPGFTPRNDRDEIDTVSQLQSVKLSRRTSCSGTRGAPSGTERRFQWTI